MAEVKKCHFFIVSFKMKAFSKEWPDRSVLHMESPLKLNRRRQRRLCKLQNCSI